MNIDYAELQKLKAQITHFENTIDYLRGVIENYTKNNEELKDQIFDLEQRNKILSQMVADCIAEELMGTKVVKASQTNKNN